MTLSTVFSRFISDTRGSTALAFGIAIIPITAALGCAIDGARWFDAKRKTEQAVDSALLAGARMMQLDGSNEGGAVDAAKKTYAANVANRPSLDNDSVSFELTDGKKAMTVAGNATMRTSFLSIVGITSLSVMPAGKSAKATFTTSGGNRGSNIEVSLMLDVTGSMCDDGSGPCTSGVKLNGLRDAAEDLIKIVIDDTLGPYTSRIALVPFSTHVRVDADNGGGVRMKKLTNLDATWSGWIAECTSWNYTPPSGTESAGTSTCVSQTSTQVTDWKIYPCVTERIYGATWTTSDVLDYTDDAPGTGKWLNAHGGDRIPHSWDSTDSNPPPGGFGQSAANPSYQWNYGPASWCEDVPEANEISPLSANKTDLINRVKNIEAGGATAGAMGVSWAWYMLSPNWSSVWTGTSTPGSYADLTAKQANGAPVLRKVAVLMSDGVFNALRGAKDQSKSMVSNHAKQICNNMKATGIEVYSVAFALDELPSADRTIAEDVMKGCAADISHFYSTLTVDELKSAFRDIALKVAPVRLTQ